ncbi:SDR family NAD(P)-dependent oxidoreductase [Flavitalea flava]
MKRIEIIGVTPLEKPDIGLALALNKANAFPVLHLGRDKEKGLSALREMSLKCDKDFGVCLLPPDVLSPDILSPDILLPDIWPAEFSDIELPDSVTLLILPYRVIPFHRVAGLRKHPEKKLNIFYQVHTLEEAKASKDAGADGIIIKGNEGAGKVSDESSFILFQQVLKEVKDIGIWVQGGIGVHTAAALMACGAAGIVLDSQFLLFPECRTSGEIKKWLEKLSGSETKVVNHYRSWTRPDISLPLGQDIALSADLAHRFQKISRLITGIREAVYGHLNQAKQLNVIRPDSALAKDWGTTYPIAQGPMTRVSDIPEFAQAVADAGALPFVALSLLKGEPARQLIRNTKKLANGKTWGVGILGFLTQELRDEQIEYIKEEKPPVVLIAGGRPSQSNSLEQAGIKTFLHVPSVYLLDMFIKEGAKRFVFEGRECGGHVGPLSSMVLWERQIERLLQEDQGDQFSILFAGGIHDAVSAAFVSVMAAPLAARGVKVGVLMGTAYLYTKEAVETGAILKKFQDQAICHSGTVLLETAPGHETRCLHSPFAEFFHAEKKRLLSEGMDKKGLWTQLESLNVGRLRMAAKGIDRKGDELVPVPEEEQVTAGMYMIGQVAALRNRVLSMDDLHKDVALGNFILVQSAAMPLRSKEEGKPLNVAIVGMACIYPGAKDIGQYWNNILSGKDCITEVPDDRWNKALYYDATSVNGDKTPSRWGGFIPRIDFDPVAYGIPPQSLAAIDPTQLLSLLVAKQALDDAGYGAPDSHMSVNHENISVIIGAEGGNDLAGNYGFRALFRQIFGEMPPELDAALPRLTEDSFPGILANVIAGRISNRLDLGGRNFTVDAACASSLAAIDLACQELVLERSDMVLAGGADLHNSINDYLLFSSTHALSPKGKCMSFDAEADGIALGEGVAMVVLKRLEDAKRDGDKIYAVIKGVGGSSDGKSLGLTAPRRSGQIKALERAYEQAGISPAESGLVEAHGTGTVVGDKTELSALSDLWLRSGAIAGQTQLGSVKTQIGHTKCAAGLAGLIKAALSVYHGIRPPTLHLNVPNNYYKEELSPFVFSKEARIWMDARRTAGISAFGFGGTNYHAVIENDVVANDAVKASPSWPAELFVFRGDSQEEARELAWTVHSILEQNDAIDLKDIAWSLSRYSSKPVQLSMVVEGTGDALQKLKLALAGKGSIDVRITREMNGKLAFLFPGQGSQRINMARSLFVLFPGMREQLEGRSPFGQILFPPAAFTKGSSKQQRERLKDTRLAQPLLGIVDLAIANFLRELGIEPDMVAGHSYGELPALCFAGVFGKEQLVSVSEKRAAAILDAAGEDKGMMVAVSCTEAVLKEVADSVTIPGIYLVNHNSPQQWVLAGGTAAMHALMDQLKNRDIAGRALEVACAFHSPLIARSKDLYKEAIRDIVFQKGSIPVWSNTTASPYPDTPGEIRQRLADHLVNPVRFSEEIRGMHAQGARIFIETGPGKVLTGLAKAILGNDESLLFLHTEDKDENGLVLLLNMLAQYMACGRPVSLERLFEGRGVKEIDLNKPEQYKKTGTVWFVDGQKALPAFGKLPVHGAIPIVTPLSFKGKERKPVVENNVHSAQLVEAYLSSVKSIVQAQRDVMLGYLSHSQQGGNHVLNPIMEVKEVNSLINGADAENVENRKEEGPAVASTAGLASRLTQADIRQILLRVVSDKTGYPPEMLGMDMDLEADLSIDSIKRLEIIGELRTQLGGFPHPGKKEETQIEELASIKTLNGFVLWLDDQSGGKRDILPEKKTNGKEKLLRFRFELRPSVQDKDTGNDVFNRLSGQRFAIAGNSGPVAPAIKMLLEKNGAMAEIISETHHLLEEYNGLILLDILSAPERFTISQSFSLVKKLNPGKIKWVYVLSDFWEQADRDTDVSLLRHFQGYTGFLKSLDKEWEHAQCRTISLDTEAGPDEIARITLSELVSQDPSTEVVYHNGQRQTIGLIPSELANKEPAQLGLNKESVILVLGGAQGITSELMIRFSKDYPCHYILVGRSPLEEMDKRNNPFLALKTKDAIKKLLIGQGQIQRPADLEKKTQEIYKQNQILHTISALTMNGATVSYKSLDVRNEGELGSFLQAIYMEHGRIDGVVHGAGLLEDKLFQHKTAESFERVFSTKVTPLRVLAEQIKEDVRFIVLFSSIASVYGNRGQTDYAAANSVLDHYARELKKKYKGKVVAFNWGPWKGAGMVSPDLEKEYERRGISLIPVQEGLETFMNELKYGKESQVLIMAE